MHFTRIVRRLADLTGLLTPAQGGTGLDASSAPAGSLLIGDGSGFALATLAAGSGMAITNGPGAITLAASVSTADVSGLTSALASKATDSTVVHLAGTETIIGAKTFAVPITGDLSGNAATATTATTAAALASSFTAGTLLGGQGSGLPATITVGSGLTLADGTLSATGGDATGTVTSVALAVPSGFSVSGSPITDAGTLTISTSLSGVLKGTGSGFAAAVAGTDYLAPTGDGSGLTGLTQGQIAGTVAVANGGTGATDAATARGNLGVGQTPRTFAVDGTPTLNAVTGTITLLGAVTCLGATAGCETAPSGGPATITIQTSDDGTTWTDLVAVSIASGTRKGTAAVTSTIAAGSMLRGKFTAVNGCYRPSASLYYKG